MKQGEIYWANLNPSRGREQGGRRPVVIISGNAMNDNFDVSIICPISSVIKNYAGCLIVRKNKINNLSADSEILTFQVRTITKERLIKKIGQISIQELQKIIQLLNEVLKY